MQIKKSILKEHLMTITVNKQIPNGHLNFTEDGVLNTMMDQTNSLLTKGLLEKKAFQNYEAIGQVYIKDMSILITLLETFSDVVAIKLENNVCKLYNENRDVNIILGEKESCSCVFDKGFPETLPWNAKFTVTKDFLGISTNDMTNLKSIRMCLAVENKVLSINVGDNNFDNTKNTLKVETTEIASVKLGVYMQEIQKVMGSQVIFNMGTDLPLKIEDNREFSKVVTILAPRVENSE